MDSKNWIPKIRATLLFVIQDERILLIRKKRGIGKGKMNGPGGKIDPGETPQQAVVREVHEELKIEVLDPQEYGELFFQFTDGLSIHCHVFRATEFTGEPTETAEARPHWTPLQEIPFHDMWEDDQYWLPLLIKEEKFKAYFEFEEEKMLSKKIWTENVRYKHAQT